MTTHRHGTCILLGAREVAERLHVRQQTVAMWRYRKLLPDPLAIVSDVPVWCWYDVRDCARSSGRLT